MLQLYTYFQSSAAYCVRIALNLKNIPYQPIFITLQAGEHQREAYRPHLLVPTLVEGKIKISQSLAILSYLERQYPTPSLLPQDSLERAWVEEQALHIACDLHPLNTLRVLDYLEKKGWSVPQQQEWYHHWLSQELPALEEEIRKKAGVFAFQDQLTWVDLCLIPQLYNAVRFDHSLDSYPTLQRIYRLCLHHPAFHRASPFRQEDCPQELREPDLS